MRFHSFSFPLLKALLLSVFLILFHFSSASAQKRPVLTEEEAVEESVTKEVEALFQGLDFKKKKNKKFPQVKGVIVVDIVVVQNGKIASFFKVDSDIRDIDFIEFLSETVLKQKFQFKLPKQQRYKIRQTINID